MRARPSFPALVLSVALVAAACSSDHDGMDMDGASMGSDGATSTISVPADADFNAADVAFAQGMIPHHAQAVEMADMALDSSSDPAVVQLARKIKAAQDPEIATMEGWLDDWGQPAADDVGSMEHGSDDMGSMAMSGMMSDEDMAELADANGPEFDRLFLEMMILHHEGAIEMAEQQLAEGEYPPAKELARAIIAAQEAEIAEMEAMLAASG